MSVHFLHGFTGSLDVFADLLAAGRGLEGRVVLQGLPGHDGRPVDPGSSFEGVADELALAIRSGSKEAHLVGYSMGARVWLGVLARHRALVASATLIGVHFGLEDEAEVRARIEADERWSRKLEVEGLEAFLSDWEKQPLFATQARWPPSVLARQAAIRRRHDPRALAAVLRQLGLGRMPSYWPILPTLDLPIRLIVGALDTKFRALAERALGYLPFGSLHVIPGAGHNVVLEAPDRVLEILRSSDAR